VGHIAIPGPDGSFDINFTTPVVSFGFLTIVDRSGLNEAPAFEAFDADGNSLGTGTFGAGSDMVDGSFGSVDYGFVGISSDEPIARVSVDVEQTILDEFIFATIPTPGTAAIAGVAVACLGRRSRGRA
jgi:hypothetical protein